MKTYEVIVAFVGENGQKVLYSKCYEVIADSKIEAYKYVHNGLKIIEFHNFIIEDVKEMEI